MAVSKHHNPAPHPQLGPIDMIVVRTRERVRGDDGRATGYRGVIYVVRERAPERFEVEMIERADGRRLVPAGDHPIVMDPIRMSDGRKIPALRYLWPTGEGYPKDRHLIHPGNEPEDSEGCQLPGMARHPHGVLYSRRAMEAIFAALGGYEPGRQFVARVVDEDGIAEAVSRKGPVG